MHRHWHSAPSHSTKRTQHNTTQHNTTRHNTTRHGTTQHNTTQHNTTRHGSAHPGERAARRCPRALPYRSIACQFAKRVRDREGERAKERGAEHVLQKMALVVLLRGRDGGMAPPPQQRALLAWHASCVQRQRDSKAPGAAPRPPPPQPNHLPASSITTKHNTQTQRIPCPDGDLCLHAHNL